MKIDPRHLIQIAAIVEAGGMTEAAALIGTAQPALSRTVAMLEKRLGTPLFLRDRRPLQPTPLCRELAAQGTAIRRAAERASNSADAFRAGELGAIRLGGTPFFTDALISGMIAEFQTRHPNVRVDQSYGYTSELAAKVRGGQLDLAICPIELLDIDSDLSFEEILPGRNVVACRTGHPLLARRPLRPVALLDYPWIEPPPGSPLSADLRTALIGLGADRVRISYSGGSLASLLNHMRTFGQPRGACRTASSSRSANRARSRRCRLSWITRPARSACSGQARSNRSRPPTASQRMSRPRSPN